MISSQCSFVCDICVIALSSPFTGREVGSDEFDRFMHNMSLRYGRAHVVNTKWQSIEQSTLSPAVQSVPSIVHS